jgi:hypothetical protein
MARSREEQAAEVARLAKRAVNLWLDAPDDQVSRPVFVVGCQRSGTTMLIETIAELPGVWVHPEKSPLACDDYRLRSPAVIDLLTRVTPAAAVVYKPVCDSHLTDRILAAHPSARAIWVVRRWSDVARSAVKKWGDHQLQVILDLAHGNTAAVGWRGERVPEAILAQLRELADGDLSPHAGAALFWYVRNSFYFSLGLDADPRVLLVRYKQMVGDKARTWPVIMDHLGVPYDPSMTAGIIDTSAGQPAPDDVPDRVRLLCEALAARFAVAGPA